MNAFNKAFVYFICLVSAMGGLLFGYDWVVIGGSKPFYELYFGIAGSVADQGLAMTIALIGCMMGACTFALWVGSSTLTYTFPMLNNLIHCYLMMALGNVGLGHTEEGLRFLAEVEQRDINHAVPAALRTLLGM